MIAEILLSRTKAEAVENVLDFFLAKYENFWDIYATTEAELAKDLFSLGLEHNRASVLKKAAETFLNQTLPIGFNDLIFLPGCGDYCANAVACFFHKERRIIYDTNTKKFVRRVFGIEGKTEVEYILNKLLPNENYVEFNYHLLDFGSLICGSKRGDCKKCPLRDICEENKDAKKN